MPLLPRFMISRSFIALFGVVITALTVCFLASCERETESPFEQGNKAYARQDYDRAIACFSDAIRLNPGVPQFYLHRGGSYDEKGDSEKALADYNEVLRLDPNVPAAYCSRAGIYYAKGEYGKAKTDYAEAIRLYSDFPEANNNYAWFLATCPNPAFRDGSKAVEHAKSACTHWTERPAFTLDTLAAAFAEAGDYEQAVEWERKYLERPDVSERDVAEASARLDLYKAHKPYHAEK